MLTLFLAAVIGVDDPAWMLAAVARHGTPKPSAVLQGHIDDTKKELELLKKSRVNKEIARGLSKRQMKNGTWSFSSKENWEKAIAGAENRLARYEQQVPGPREFPPLPYNLEVGAAGSVWNSVVVSQVVSPQVAIIEMVDVVSSTGVRKSDKFTIWLECDTTNWIDGKERIGLPPILITGTKQYATAGNSTRTVFTARSWTPDEQNRFKELAKARDRE